MDRRCVIVFVGALTKTESLSINTHDSYDYADTSVIQEVDGSPLPSSRGKNLYTLESPRWA